MKFIRNALSLIATLLVISCNSGNKSIDFLQVDVKLEDNTIHLSDIFSSVEIVPLQTTDLSLITDGAQLKFSDQFIFIESNKSIKLFDYEGNFVKNIDRKGNGAGEYLGISDFYVDDNSKKIEVLDKRQKKILQYNHNGDYLSEIPLNFWAVKFTRDTNKDLFVYSGNERDNNNAYKFNIFDNEGNGYRFYGIDEKKSKFLHILNLEHFYKSGDEMLFFEPFNDTIYNFKENKLKPKYVISYNGKNVPPSFYEDNNFSNVFEFFQEFKKYGYINSTYNAFETQTKLYFQCFKQSEKYLISYDKKTSKSFSYNKIVDDLFSKGKELPFQESDITFFAENSTVMFMVHPSWIIENKINELYPNLNNLKEDDNSLLFIGKLK